MVVNLPTELLRSFTAIVDAGSMLRATERVFVTQSALSLNWAISLAVRSPSSESVGISGREDCRRRLLCSHYGVWIIRFRG